MPFCVLFELFYISQAFCHFITSLGSVGWPGGTFVEMGVSSGEMMVVLKIITTGQLGTLILKPYKRKEQLCL